ncbi:flavin monoamine oxidase family protein [Flavicella marina]|uniref:flavin monoamine oxidase family protein n=1 Tax=Flavicella marina TaxID=1475951 RepID=UPI0012644744|nr:NAD(P)/FAD-dependent oxidoreductase [Flavicella marina]
MNRKEFIKKSLALGIGLPLINLFLDSCTSDEGIDFPVFETNFSGKVLIVGAGAAGLAAGYLLHRYGVDFEILEANSTYGGRTKRNTSLANFPIDLGAEWIHQSPSVLAEIINNPEIDATLDFIVYNPQSIKTYNSGKLSSINFGSNYYSEHKFKNTSWFGFFEQFIVPDILPKIRVNSPVTNINYQSQKVTATVNNTTVYEADKILITTPINVLKSDLIEFTPKLPSDKTNAINSITMGDGIKVFIEFSEKFYPDILLFGGVGALLSDSSEKIYYDAAFRKNTTKNILGFFCVQYNATPYTSLGSDQEIIAYILAELDEVFDGKASKHYLNHVIQNWSKEPYILGSYASEFDGDENAIKNTISNPIENKVYFAGEAISIDNQSTVDGACESGYFAVETMLT